MIRLFGLGSVLGYKKKHRRELTDVFAAWAEYRRLLATLERADPLLFLSACIPPIVDPSIKSHVRVFGDMSDGHIVVPDRAALPA